MSEEAKNKAYCDGMHYNFKKGFEYCPNKEKCPLFKYFKSLEKPYEHPRKRFNFKKDFVKCNEYKSNQSN